MALNHDVLSPSKPEIGFVLRSLPLPSLRHTVLSLRDCGGQDVGRTVARLDPWPARFLHLSSWGPPEAGCHRGIHQRHRVLTAFDAIMGFHLALRLNLRFSHTGLLLPYLSLHFACRSHPFCMNPLTNTYSTDTQNSCTSLPKKSPNALNCDRSWLLTRKSCYSVRVDSFPECQSLPLIRTQ